MELELSTLSQRPNLSESAEDLIAAGPARGTSPTLANMPKPAGGVKGQSLSLPILATYMDYRQYLQDFYEFRRNQTRRDLRPYSYSTFAAAANIRSPNYLKMIIDGKRNLSEDMIIKFARAMGLNKAEGQEFRLLVLFNQAVEPAERNVRLRELSDNRVGSKLKTGEIDRKAWEKLPSWVAWVLYAMTDQENVNFSPDELRRLLRGKVRREEIEAAMRTLIESHEVAVEPETGEVRKTRTFTDAPEEIPVALIRKLQAQLMLLGLESLYQDSPTEREFGTLTLALTQSEFEEIRFKLRQMRKQLHKDNSIQRMSSKGERVYQLNLQLFPVTNRAVVSPETQSESAEKKGGGVERGSAQAGVQATVAELAAIAAHNALIAEM